MEAGTYMLETVFINAGIFIVLNVYLPGHSILWKARLFVVLAP